MSDNLLPCPFCGERAHMHAVNGPYCGNFECALHLVSGFNLDAWNKRAWQAARTVPEGMLDVVREIVDLHSQTGTVLTVKIDELAALLSAAPEGKK